MRKFYRNTIVKFVAAILSLVVAVSIIFFAAYNASCAKPIRRPEVDAGYISLEDQYLRIAKSYANGNAVDLPARVRVDMTNSEINVSYGHRGAWYHPYYTLSYDRITEDFDMHSHIVSTIFLYVVFIFICALCSVIFLAYGMPRLSENLKLLKKFKSLGCKQCDNFDCCDYFGNGKKTRVCMKNGKVAQRKPKVPDEHVELFNAESNGTDVQDTTAEDTHEDVQEATAEDTHVEGQETAVEEK